MTGVDFFLTGIVLMLFGWKLYFDYADRKEERRQREKNARHSKQSAAISRQDGAEKMHALVGQMNGNGMILSILLSLLE